ncbi:MAG: hypothetical protein JO303_08885 [Caulobacteraceae bacterium]|nr:hypothetical protein [Caulobacteraceae bacterium]
MNHAESGRAMDFFNSLLGHLKDASGVASHQCGVAVVPGEPVSARRQSG